MSRRGICNHMCQILTDCCADAFFQNVCELDLVFSFYKVSASVWSMQVCHGLDGGRAFQVYAIMDEVFLAGEIEETSKNVVLVCYKDAPA